MADTVPVTSAAALGAAGGARTMVPVAALVLGGRGPSGPARYALLAAALGEMATDKLPGVPGRVTPPALAGRVTVAGVAGHAVAGRRGAAAAAAAAAVSTLGTWRARSALPQATGLPDPVVAAAEDVLALTVAGLAVRSAHSGEADGQAGEFTEDDVPGGLVATLKDVGRGLAAAAVGTAAMTGAQLLYYRVSGDEQSQAPAKVADKALRGIGVKVPRKRRDQLNWASHIGYGLSWGIPYGIAAARKPQALKSGLTFGAAVWAASLVELPSLGQAPPVWEMEPFHIALDGGFHLIYGVAAGAALAALS